MTLIKREDGSEALFHIGDNPEFEIRTWCSDTEGKVPEQVHLVLRLTPDTSVMYRFTGPVVLTRLIEALTSHRDEVWHGPGRQGMNPKESQDRPLRVMSLGWGVQSFTLAVMAALREIDPVDVAIHADTTHEHQGTYQHARKWTPWLERRGVPIVTARAKRTSVVEMDWGQQGSIMIPAFTIDRETGKKGQIRRQCTEDWKIRAIRRVLRANLPIRPRPGSVHMLMGISYDEWPRMRTSDVAYVENHYPLVDLRMTRDDCVAYLESRGMDVPPKSACTFCPYHSIESWRELKRRGGGDWERAVRVDSYIRHKRAAAGGLEIFVHPARVPLAEAVHLQEGELSEALAEEQGPCDSGMCWT